MFVSELKCILKKALKQTDMCLICNNPFLEGKVDPVPFHKMNNNIYH